MPSDLTVKIGQTKFGPKVLRSSDLGLDPLRFKLLDPLRFLQNNHQTSNLPLKITFFCKIDTREITSVSAPVIKGKKCM
jgi:hypothetical protein